MKTNLKKMMAGIFLLYYVLSINAQEVNVDVNLNIKHSVDNVSDFGRERHIISHTGPTDPDWSGHEEMMDYFFNDLDVYLGRDNGSFGWKNRMVTEDPNKPHWPDVISIETVGNGLKNWYESNDHIDRHQYENRSGSLIMGQNPYPVYPSLDWGEDGKMNSGWQTYDVDAAAFFVAEYLDKNYAKTSDDIGEFLPTYWECINEPDMAILKPFVMFLSSPEKLFEFHNLSAQEIRRTLGDYAPKVGGFTWGQHDFWASDWINRVDAEASYYNFSDPSLYPVYDNMWLGGNPSSMRSQGSPIYSQRGEIWWQWDGLYQSFIDECGENMDFYSVHVYDWPDTDNGGTIRTGGHTEAMLDMIEWYDMYKFNARKEIIISEYGSVHTNYITGLGYKRKDWENLRPFNQMFMQFLERPSHLTLTMPFAPIKATWGDSWNADGSLLQRYEVTMMDPIGTYEAPGNAHENWEWSDIILWYKLWQDVKGTRIDTKASDRDIQVDAYVDENHVYLILNNLEIDPTDINLNLFDDYANDIVSVKMTHQYLNESLNRPVNDVKKLKSAPGKVTLAMSATMILDYEFANPVTINQESKEYKYMSLPLTNATNRFGSQLCHITNNAGNEFVANVNEVTVPSIGEATLRIGMRIWNGVKANIVVNDQTLLVQDYSTTELIDLRGRETSRGGNGYWGVIEVDIPIEHLQTDNEVKIKSLHSNMEISSIQIQTWDFTKEPGRTATGNGNIPVSSIVLQGENSVMQGEELALKVNFSPVNATSKAVVWSSSNPSVATVNEFGVVKGIANSGSAIITATSTENGSAIATKTINAVPFQATSVTGISIQEGNSITVEHYVNTPLTANISPVDASSQTVVWSSSNPEVVEVLPESNKIVGKVVNESAIITATVTDTYSGNTIFTDNINVYVTIVGEESVFNRQLPDLIRPFPDSELYVDVRTMGSRRVEMTIHRNGTVIGQGSLNFEHFGDTTLSVPYTLLNTNPQIETDYNVTFTLYNGSTQLDTSTASVYMADHIRADSVEIVEGMRKVQIGTSIQLDAVISPDDTYNKNVSWSSTNPGVASVNNSGVVTGVSVGQTVITVTTEDGGKTDQVTVLSQVDPVHYHIQSITLADTIYVFPGRTKEINYSYSPSYATDTEIGWSSANNSVASVDANGIISAGTSLESTVITATASDTSGVSASSAVIVTQTVFIEAESMINTGGTYDGFIIGNTGINNNQLGDWGEYEVDIPVSGDYLVRYYIGAPDVNTDIAVNIYIDDTLMQTTTLAPTGGWDNYQPFDAASNINITAGLRTIRIESAGSSDWQWNMDRFELILQGNLPCDPLTDITTPTTHTVGVNGESTINFTTVPACQKQQGAFTWSSSNTNIATVNQTGKVTGIANGQVNITVQSGNIGSTTQLTVTVITPTSVAVEPNSVNLAYGSTVQLNAVVLPDYSSDKSVTWSSNNANVTVDQNGIVSGAIIGETATITATSVAEPTLSGSASITIVDAPQSLIIEAESFNDDGGTTDDGGSGGIGVNNAGTYIDWVNSGDWVEYIVNAPVAGEYSIAYHISTKMDNAQIKFMLGGVTISTDNVPNNGVWDNFIELEAANNVTLSAGENTIRIEASGSNTWQWNLDKIVLEKVQAVCEVTNVDISQSNFGMNIGENTTLTVNVTSTGNCNSVNWTTSNSSIATVNSNGVVSALSNGDATITATSVTTPSQYDEVIITVGPDPCVITGITIDQSNQGIYVNESITLSATVTSTGSCTNDVNWSSSNDAIVSVTSNGVITGIAEGTSEITAISADDSLFSTSITVTVSQTTTNDFTLGNPGTARTSLDGWSSNMVINKTDTYTNNSGSTQQVTVETFEFYANRQTDPLTPFVVKVNGNDDFTVLAVGTTRNSSAYNIGINSLAFSDGSPKVISLANGETIASGFLDANDDGSGGGSGSVIPFDQIAPVDALWYSGSGNGNGSGSVVEGSAPVQGSQTLNLSRNYSYNIQFSLGGVIIIPVQDVTITPASLSLNIGETFTLTAATVPGNATNQNLTWSSDNTASVTVSNIGVVSAIADGSANVIVTTSDGNYQDTCVVSVNSIPTMLTIEAEDFIETGGTLDDSQWGGPGKKVNKTSNNINWVNNEDWTEYNVTIPQDGAYEIVYYISSPNDGSTISFTVDNGLLNTTTVPNNTEWDNYEPLPVSETVNLFQGDRLIRLTAGVQTWTWNLDKFTLERKGVLKNAGTFDSNNSISFELYPNPASDYINIHVIDTEKTEATVYMYNLVGKLVLNEIVPTGIDYQLNTSGFSKGMYIMRIENSRKSILIK